MTFILYFGLTNLLYFLPDDFVSLIDVQPTVTALMNKLLLLIVIGAVAMWLGYWSPLAARLTVKGPLVRFQTQFFRVNTAPKAWVLPLLVLVSLACRLIQVRLGVFGYASSYERLIEAASYTQYLSMGSSLGKLALVVASFRYYSLPQNRLAKLWFLGILLYEIIFGFLGGFKSAVVMPLIIVLLCQYIKIGRLSRKLLIAIPLALILALVIIEPFRYIKNARDKYGYGFDSTSLTNIASALSSSAKFAVNVTETNTDNKNKALILLNTMNRLNLTSVGSLGISFADDHKNLPAGSPEFFWDIILAPLHAWIPRFLWEGKPLQNTGLWYTKTVVNPMLGRGVNSSTAMGVFTHLYFAGGTIAIFCGLFFIGFINRLLFFTTQPWLSDSGGIVFMSMMATTAVIAEGTFNGIIVSLFRELPLLLALMAFFYKPTRRVT
jgi:hypothetical protein